MKRKTTSETKTDKKKTILDTNILFLGIGLRKKLPLKAIRIATARKEHVYTETVDEELSRYHGDDPKTLSRIQRFRNRQKNNIVKVKHATDEELSKYPLKGPGDKRIMDEAVKTDSKIIVTMDKLFRKRVNKEENEKKYGIRAMDPKEYIRSTKRNKK